MSLASSALGLRSRPWPRVQRKVDKFFVNYASHREVVAQEGCIQEEFNQIKALWQQNYSLQVFTVVFRKTKMKLEAFNEGITRPLLYLLEWSDKVWSPLIELEWPKARTRHGMERRQ